MANRAIERHLQSKHPEVPKDRTKPVPGKYLLDKRNRRSALLESRIRATRRASRTQAAAPPSAVYPGIAFRPALTAGDISNSVVTGDFNRDGHMDFVVANGGTNDLWIYLGNGDGSFQLPKVIPLTKGLTPVYMVTADLRGTGVLDLIVAEFDTLTIGVLLGNGDGTFGFEQEYGLPEAPAALVVDDFNRDGKLDIAAVMVTVNNPTGTGVQYLATLIGSGTGSFAGPLITTNPGFYSTAQSIASGDVNNDGYPDLLITGPGLENSQLYLNNRDGTFSPGAVVVQNSFANGIPPLVMAGALGDVNGDGCLDALVADGYSMVWISLGDCGGNFAALSYVFMGDSNASIVLADMNGDGHTDIVTTTFDLLVGGFGYGEVAGNMVAVALGDGHGNFVSPRDYVGTGMSYSVAIGDFNGDGHPDAVTASPDTDTATVYINDGAGGFGFPQGEWIGLPGVGIIDAPVSPPSFADLNGDGRPDVLLLDQGYNGEYFITTMLNDGTGRFAGPVATDAGLTSSSERMGDYRLGDFRNTGHLDFVAIGLGLNYTVGIQYIVFARGNGDGTFGKPTVTATPGAEGEMAVGDFNRDGKLDLVAVGASPSGSGWVLTTFLGNGDGTFRTGFSMSFSDSAADMARVFAGDFNRDGKLDILVYDTANGDWTTSSYVWEFLGNGDGTFHTGTQLFSKFQPMTMADVNNDGWLDLVRYDFMWPDGLSETLGPAKFTNYVGQASGGFTQSSSYLPYTGVPRQGEPYLQFGDPTTASKTADLNGDGKLDEIAFQQVTESNGDAYAQILMGNGDGTFTPTYDVFDFQKNYYFPEYAHILDGTKVSDLLEVDGVSSSMHVFKGAPAPALQIALQDAQVNGTSSCGWVFLNVPSTSDTSIALSSSISGVDVPASVTVPGGSLSQQFCYTLSPAFSWRQVFDIRAQLGSDIAVANASQSYVFGFSEAISPATNPVIYPTQSTTPITISLTSSQGYSSTVQLSCWGLPAGATCAFGSDVLSVSPSHVASTTLVINTTAATQSGGTVLVVASDSEVVTRQAFDLVVQPLIVAPELSLSQATSPGSATGSILIVGIPPYVPSCSGLPPGVTCAFSGTQQPYPTSTTLAVTINVPAAIAAGNYPFTVDVKSGPADMSLGLTLDVTDFSLQPPAPTADWIPPGGSENLNVSAQAINGFFGMVNFTCSLDVGGSCTGGTFPVAGTSANQINLTLSVPSTVAASTAHLTVTGTIGSLSHTAVFPFYVADYGGTLSQSAITLTRGASTSFSATVTATTGFEGSVTLGCTGTTQVTCSLAPSTVNPTANSPQTVNITLTAGNLAFASPAKRGFPSTSLLALILPVGMIFVLRGSARTRWLPVASGLLLLLLMAIASSCGGSSGATGGGGQGGSSTYNITVNATAEGTITTRVLGIVRVTVTH